MNKLSGDVWTWYNSSCCVLNSQKVSGTLGELRPDHLGVSLSPSSLHLRNEALVRRPPLQPWACAPLFRVDWPAKNKRRWNVTVGICSKFRLGTSENLSRLHAEKIVLAKGRNQGPASGSSRLRSDRGVAGQSHVSQKLLHPLFFATWLVSQQLTEWCLLIGRKTSLLSNVVIHVLPLVLWLHRFT